MKKLNIHTFDFDVIDELFEMRRDSFSEFNDMYYALRFIIEDYLYEIN